MLQFSVSSYNNFIIFLLDCYLVKILEDEAKIMVLFCLRCVTQDHSIPQTGTGVTGLKENVLQPGSWTPVAVGGVL